MRNATWYVPNLRAKSPFKLRIVRRKSMSRLVDPCNRSWVRRNCAREWDFPTPAPEISAPIFTRRVFTRGRTR